MDRKNLEINPLREHYNEYIEKINSALDDELGLYSQSEFCEPLKFAIEGGKRIRPIILLLASESVGKIDENAFAGACAIELLHTESVIHDDIIDNEIKRREKDPFHIKFGYGRVMDVSGNRLLIDFEKAGQKKIVDDFVEKT